MKCGNCDTPLVERELRGESYPSCPACRCFWPRAETLALVHRHRRPAPAGATLSLTFEPNGTSHNDLLLRLGRWAHSSDTYYYELDHAVDRPADEARSIRDLLTGWLVAVNGCKDGEQVLLPHAFFDQCTGWLRCSCEGESFALVDGWSNLEGWSFYPSDFAEKAQEVADFRVDDDFGPPVILNRSRLVADIGASLAALEDEPETPTQGT